MGSVNECLFCQNNTKMTREHVIPKHWRKEFPNAGGLAARRDGLSGRFERPESGGTTMYDIEVNQICAACNNGWMQSMDMSIKELVLGLAWGKTRQIPARQVTALAAWCTKVALLRTYLDRGDRQDAAPDQFHRFYQRRLQLAPQMVQLGTTAAPGMNMHCHTPSFIMLGRGGAIVSSAHVVTFALGQFIFQVGLPRHDPWSLNETQKMLAAARRSFSGKLQPLLSAKPHTLAKDHLTKREVLLCGEIGFLQGRAPLTAI